MHMWRLAAWFLAACLIVPATVGAQGFKWWQSDRFKADLTLTVEQTAKLEDVYQRLLPRLATGKETLDRLEQRLNGVIAEGVAPEADVMKLVDQVEEARAELSKTRTLMIYRMHQTLTPEQRVKMNAIHDRWEQDRRQGRRPPQK